MSRKTLFRKLSKCHGENVLIMLSHGYINVMGFRSESVQSLQLVEVEYCMDRVASTGINECLALKIKRKMYHVNTDAKRVRESGGDTIPLLLSNI